MDGELKLKASFSVSYLFEYPRCFDHDLNLINKLSGTTKMSFSEHITTTSHELQYKVIRLPVSFSRFTENLEAQLPKFEPQKISGYRTMSSSSEFEDAMVKVLALLNICHP